MEISENTQQMMEDIETGAAFDTSMLTTLDSMKDQWPILATEQDTLFGTYSPIYGMFDGLADETPLSLADIDNLDITGVGGEPLTEAEKAALVDRPSGPLAALRQQAETQFSGIVDNISLYASHQRVQNAMGKNTGCNALSDHFGSITDMGQRVSGLVDGAKNAIDEFRLLKTQVQSEIDSFDTNVINILTGRVNGTILSNLVAGTGLHDQIDKVLIDAGIADDSQDAIDIRSQVGEFLTPALDNFFSKKGSVNSTVSDINNERGGIMGQISKEATVFDEALTTLKKLGAANSLSGLFAANECIQTLMGFVATTPFLNKLGRG